MRHKSVRESQMEVSWREEIDSEHPGQPNRKRGALLWLEKNLKFFKYSRGGQIRTMLVFILEWEVERKPKGKRFLIFDITVLQWKRGWYVHWQARLLPNCSQGLDLRNVWWNASWNCAPRSKGQCQVIAIQDVNRPQIKNSVSPCWMLW